jgi:hypothetical protein
MVSRIRQIGIIALLCTGGTCNTVAYAAKPYADRAALAKVQRIAVVTPFFCTDAIKREPRHTGQQQYRDALQFLEQTIQKRLPVGLAESGRFRIAPPELTARTLQALGWAPQDFYEEEATLKGAWPKPDPKKAAQLAKRMRVDAVLVAALREPASIKEGYALSRNEWDTNPLNFSLKRYNNHVVSPRVQAFLFNAEGKMIWRDEQMAYHPRTKPHTPKTLRVDWQEATLQVAQQLTDNLMREADAVKHPKVSAERPVRGVGVR